MSSEKTREVLDLHRKLEKAQDKILELEEHSETWEDVQAPPPESKGDIQQLKELLEGIRDDKKSKKDWFTAPMITTYLAIFGVLATSGEGCWSRYEAEIEARINQENSLRARGATFDYVLQEQQDIEDRIMLHLDAIITSLPSHQQLRINNMLSEDGIKRVPDSRPRTPIATIRRPSVDFTIHPDRVETFASEDTNVDLEEEPLEDIFMMIQRAAEKGDHTVVQPLRKR